MMRPGRAAQTRRLVIVVNNPAFFLSHRLAVADGARAAGWEVHVATAPEPAEAAARIAAAGFTHHAVPITRGHASPVAEFATLRALLALFHRVRPTLVHLVTIKPVLYGSLAARAAKVPGLVVAISGLGHALTGEGRAAALLKSAIRRLYRHGVGHRNKCVIFQNDRDRAVLESWGVRFDGQAEMIPGSGVRLDAFAPDAVPEAPPLAVMVSRLLRPKGVAEFVAAAEILRARGSPALFALVGAPDPGNPETVTQADLAAWEAGGAVALLGHREDVPAILARATLVALPSYYGEGMPKTLLEAAAAARAVVTTDLPGCRDAVRPGESGLLVPPRDPRALADAMGALLADPARAAAMGRAGRAQAEARFSIEEVVARHLAIYDRLADRAAGAPRSARAARAARARSRTRA